MSPAPLRPLDGRKVVVIGGSAGIGLATAELAIDAGASVAVAARGSERLAEAVDRLAERGDAPVFSRSLRIEDRAAVAAFLADCAPFDHLVMPGSTVVPTLYDDLHEENAGAGFDSKFWGPFWAAKDSRAHMRRGGSVVFFSGIAAERPVKGYTLGAAINGAINAMTKSLALDFGAAGLRVNTIAPGLIRTPLWDALHGHDRDAAFDAKWAKLLPAGRVGRPEEGALGALYLMANGFVTGQVITIDGGHVCME
jgi:NAD(P)-dependent dehydrogenase (short-subunit alcohol dehydrogenase family)